MRIAVRIEGACPILFSNGLQADPEYIYTREKKKITAKKKKVDADHAEIDRLSFLGCLYTTAKGHVIVPARMLLGCFIAGSRKFRKGKDAAAGVVVEKDVPLLYDGPRDPEALYADSRFVHRCTVKQQRARIVRVRPKFDEWAVEFTLVVEDDVMDIAEVRDCLVAAGRFAALGDWRPQYGRFTVSKFEPIEEATAEEAVAAEVAELTAV